jgi:hypothetical protein
VIPVVDPLDIVSILYSTEPTTLNNSAPQLVTKMKVSDMTAIPPSSNWRINFTANARNSVLSLIPSLSPTLEYTFGVSDRGDQFFVRATTDSSGGQTFTYGKAVRNFDGSITYTDVGPADCGFFDPATQTITMKVALSSLNAQLPLGHGAISTSSILAGLRGSTFTTAGSGASGNNRTDTARGGTQYTVALGPLTTSCVPTAAPATISGQVNAADGSPLSGVTISLGGASSRRTITDTSGNYRFENVDTDNFYTVTPVRVNYHFSPDNRAFSLLGNKTDAVFTATPDAVIVANPLDSADFFVRQHYLDFLGREPDENGFNFWSDQMSSCGNDADCLERRRINVSAAYFLSIEFQETGGLVDGLYRASYGRRPLYLEFIPDTATVAHGVIVGRGNWAQQLAANKAAFVNAWVQRPAFTKEYGNLSNDSYVDELIAHTGVSYSQAERAALVSGLTAGTSTRAQVLQTIAEDQRFINKKHNEAFVMMEYFGYLRRDPDEAGLRFWLAKLNQFDGNFEQAEMVKAFIVSGEYRARFSR